MSAVRLILLETEKQARDYLAKSYMVLYVIPNQEENNVLIEDVLEHLKSPESEEAYTITSFLDAYFALEAKGYTQGNTPLSYEEAAAQRYQVGLAATLLNIPFTPFQAPEPPQLS